MLVIIDGTGESNSVQYQETMKKGFLKQLEKESPIYPKKYFRGPTWSGSECDDIVQSALNWISQNMQGIPRGTKPELYLAGYSRGGTIAIAIAQEIQKLAANPTGQSHYDRGSYLISEDHADQFNKELYDTYAHLWRDLNDNIKCLALFDAVDRALFMNTDVIPKNVQMAYHALRSPTAGSRRSFGNTGTSHESGPAHYLPNYFLCTHAAMGGVPWTGDHPTEYTGYGSKIRTTISILSPMIGLLSTDIVRDEGIGLGEIKGLTKPLITEAQDNRGSNRVHDWMWTNMRRHNMV